MFNRHPTNMQQKEDNNVYNVESLGGYVLVQLSQDIFKQFLLNFQYNRADLVAHDWGNRDFAGISVRFVIWKLA